MTRPECICCSLPLKDPEENIEEVTACLADAKETTIDAATGKDVFIDWIC